MSEQQQPRHLPSDWTGDIDELVGLEDRLRERNAADRVFANRAEAFAAGHALAIEAARRAHVALSEGYVVADRPAGHIRANTLTAARLDPFGGAQWEIACELELGRGNRIPLVIDCNTATELGQALIAQAALSTKDSNNEFDAQMVRYAPRAADSEDEDEIPF